MLLWDFCPWGLFESTVGNGFIFEGNTKVTFSVTASGPCIVVTSLDVIGPQALQQLQNYLTPQLVDSIAIVPPYNL